MTETTTEKPKCLVDGCEASAKTRGLCGAHYSFVNNQIKQGHMDEAKLVAAGKLKPAPVRRDNKIAAAFFKT